MKEISWSSQEGVPMPSRLKWTMYVGAPAHGAMHNKGQTAKPLGPLQACPFQPGCVPRQQMRIVSRACLDEPTIRPEKFRFLLGRL